MRVSNLFFSIFFLLITASPGFVMSEESVDQMIVKHIDVTGDGIGDDIILNIKGENWNKPFKWMLTISAKGKIIFKHTSDDTWLDKFFNDRGYVNETCKLYLECKKQYYLKDLPDHLIIKTDLSQNNHAYDKSNPGSVHFAAKKELTKTLKLSEAEATKTVEWMTKKLKTGQVPVLYVPKSPVQSEFPKMYVDKVGQFVTIYEW